MLLFNFKCILICGSYKEMEGFHYKQQVKNSLSDCTVAILSMEIMNLDIVLSTIIFDTFNKLTSHMEDKTSLGKAHKKIFGPVSQQGGEV